MEFNVNPYYDDFEQNAKDNNYLKILFKPGYSVQARELTQIQSILQNQIKAFGDHIFQDGSPVIGGNLTLDNKITYVKIDETYNNEDIELDLFVDNIIIRDSDGLVQAKVLASYFPSGGTPTLMVKYLSGAEFSDGDVFKVAGTTTKAKCIDSSATGKGTVVSINEGIFYVNGYFVTVNPQTAVVGAYSQNANVKIGLEISDDVVDYAVDSTLLDPAQGAFNYQAPGADRYQFNLNLSTRPLTTAIDESSFFELMRVEDGAITKQVKYPIYSEIEKTLARRTFDESGDYTVVPFTASVAESSNSDNYIINIDPGKAYVKGFEFETLGAFKMEVEKPRTVGVDTRSMVDIDVETSFGNYLKFKNVYGSANSNSFFNIASLEQVDLHCVPANSVNVGLSGGATANVFMYGNTKIGTAKIRSIKRYSSAGEAAGLFDSNGIYDIYFTDIDVRPKVLVMNTAAVTSNTVNLTLLASSTSNAYQNVSLTVLPIQLANIPNVNTANVFINSTRVNANSSVANTFYDPLAGFANVGVGAIIRVGEDVRQVVNIGVDAHGNYLIVNTAFTKTIVGTNQSTNPLHVYKQTGYSSNVTNQTRTIERYDGSTRIAYLDRPFDNAAVPAQNTVLQLNFGIKDLESIMEANVATPVVNAHANIAIQSKLINGDVELFENLDRNLIFRLPRDYAKRGSLNNVDYVYTKYIENKSGTSGIFTINQGNGLTAPHESIPWSVTNANIEDNLVCIVRQNNGGTKPNGSILQLSTANVATTTGSGITVTTDATVLNMDIFVNVKTNDAEDRIRTKTLKSNPNYTLSPTFNYPKPTDVTNEYTVNVPNVGNVAKINVANGLIFITEPSVTRIGPGDAINLYVPDVVRVRKVLAGNTTDPAQLTNYRDITDNFVIDYGQKDEIYDHAKLILKQGYPAPNAQLTIHADFFLHNYPSGTESSFFCVDSYSQGLYDSGDIPIYVSPKSQDIFFLQDCLDFRPTREIGYADGRIQNGAIPQADASTELSFDYFLPRVDKLVLSKNKEFRIIKGVSSATPVPPDDDADAMTLYNIYLPPYVADVRDIRLKYIENKRYTMKDIASLDKRIQAVEYYTSLNNIENKAFDDNTQYEDGTEKEKFGIVGENFRNYNIADYKNPDFSVSMQRNNMTPYMSTRMHGLKLLGNSLTQENGKTVSLQYTETPAIIQDMTSNKSLSVQPFLFGAFIGDVTLTPEVDYWVSEELKPEVIRGPEVTKEIVREIITNEVITERIIEREVIVTVPTPVTNAQPVIITTPGGDPPAPLPADELPITPPSPPYVVPPEPTPIVVEPPLPEPDVPAVITPIVPLPVFEIPPQLPVIPVDPAPVATPIPTIPTPVPVYSVPVLGTTRGGMGGGCVVLESYLPIIELRTVNGSVVKQAYQMEEGIAILLSNEGTLVDEFGQVVAARNELQPCVRITTACGATLVCSESAPIPTMIGEVIKAPNLKGHIIAVKKDNKNFWDPVVSIESVGEKFVRAIDTGNHSFWAGEVEGTYILHHNALVGGINDERGHIFKV